MRYRRVASVDCGPDSMIQDGKLKTGNRLPTTQHAGFTLIELLVVIAIITILSTKH